MLTCARHRRYWWTGMSKSRVLTSEESFLCGLDTNVVILQLEDPFGYDRADIKVDAIVEDLRVRTALSSRITPASALAKPQAQFTKQILN
jgi:predicted membrane chloride channel (bestrophin family)